MTITTFGTASFRGLIPADSTKTCWFAFSNARNVAVPRLIKGIELMFSSILSRFVPYK